MKRVLLGLLMLLCCFGSITQAQTNTPALTPPTVNQLVATNANQIMIEILTGVKSEGAQIYKTTKEALGQAYESVKKEAPEVLREFMTWRLVHHGMWLGVFATLAGSAFYWSRRFKKLAAECPAATQVNEYYRTWDDHGKFNYLVLRYLLVAVTSLLLLIGGSINLYTMAKIYVAPRVYIIEYVVSTVQSASQPPHR